MNGKITCVDLFDFFHSNDYAYDNSESDKWKQAFSQYYTALASAPVSAVLTYLKMFVTFNFKLNIFQGQNLSLMYPLSIK